MKLIEKIFVIFCFIIIGWAGTSFAETGTVNISATRLRKENNTDSDIITNIYEDDKVEILGEAGEWYQIKYDGKTGYVKKEYITVSKKNNSSENKTKSENKTSTNSSNTNSSNTTNKVSNNSSKDTSNKTNNATNSSSKENVSNSSATNNATTNLDENVVITNSLASLRSIPSMLSASVAQIEQSKQLTKLNEMGNWVQVSDGNIKGWISRSKIIVGTQEPINSNDFSNNTNENVIENKTNTSTNSSSKTNTSNTTQNTTSKETAVSKTGIINVETAKVRESANATAKVIEFLDYNDKVNIEAEDGEWYKITSSKASGYVNKRLITISNEKEQVTSRSLTETRIAEDNSVVEQNSNNNLTNIFNNSNLGNEVAEYAKQYIGCSYVVGGKNPTSGFDCSGFTKYVYSNFGYTLGSTASSQTSIGTEISRDNLQVGDLILFYNEGKTSIGHTGIYIGNGEFVHSANPKRGVVTDNLNTSSYYNERFVSARRIVN